MAIDEITASMRRERILKGYLKATGDQVPFFVIDMSGKDLAEAYDLMEEAIEAGKPVDDADVERLSPPKREPGTFIM